MISVDFQLVVVYACVWVFPEGAVVWLPSSFDSACFLCESECGQEGLGDERSLRLSARI